MKVAVVCLRSKGRRVPKWLLHRAQRFEGHLTITEETDKDLHRTSRVARIIEVERRPVEVLPPLFDATLLWMNYDQMAITGFERVDTTGDFTDYAQTWLCEKATRS
jgi:hypothetical protein